MNIKRHIKAIQDELSSWEGISKEEIDIEIHIHNFNSNLIQANTINNNVAQNILDRKNNLKTRVGTFNNLSSCVDIYNLDNELKGHFSCSIYSIKEEK